jgi:hypothetical protein
MALGRAFTPIALCFLVACSGGGGSPSARSQSQALASGKLVLAIPAKSAASRDPQRFFLSPSASSVSIAVSGIAQAVVADVSATSPQCATVALTRTCSITVKAPIAFDTFTATLYTGPNATGLVLGIGTASQNIGSGTAFSLTIPVSGEVASIQVSAAQAQFTTGVAGATAVTISALDAGGNVIAGSYTSPIALAVSDTTGTFTISPTTITNSTTAVTLAYSGGIAATSTTISGSAAGVSGTSVTPLNVSLTCATLATPGPSPSASASPTATPSASPTASPTPNAVGTQLFASNSSGCGVAEYEAATGALTQTFAPALKVAYVGMDDAGNVYTLFPRYLAALTPAEGVSKVAIGGHAVLASYMPTSPYPYFLIVSPEGELVVAGTENYVTNPAGYGSEFFDVWDPGTSGSPSRTFAYPEDGNATEPFGPVGVAADGTLFLPYFSGGAQKFDVVPPGGSAPSRTIVDTLAPDSLGFDPNWTGVGADGTFYVGEWTFLTGDVNAGLYVFPPSGPERVVTSMAAGINGIDFDAAGDIYVASNNATSNTGTPGPDTAQQVSVYSPGAAALLRQFSDGAPGVDAITVGDDGTAYLSQYAGSTSNGPATFGNVLRVPPGSSAASVLIANTNAPNLVLYDGTNAKGTLTKETRPRRVFRASLGGRGFGLAGGRFLLTGARSQERAAHESWR